jgi:hypothetical protein
MNQPYDMKTAHRITSSINGDFLKPSRCLRPQHRRAAPGPDREGGRAGAVANQPNAGWPGTPPLKRQEGQLVRALLRDASFPIPTDTVETPGIRPHRPGMDRVIRRMKLLYAWAPSGPAPLRTTSMAAYGGPTSSWAPPTRQLDLNYAFPGPPQRSRSWRQGAVNILNAQRDQGG